MSCARVRKMKFVQSYCTLVLNFHAEITTKKVTTGPVYINCPIHHIHNMSLVIQINIIIEYTSCSKHL